MKRYGALAATVAVLVCLTVPVFAGGNEDDLKVIKRAVSAAPAGNPAKPVRLFRILITDNKSRTDIVRISLPISTAKLLARCGKGGHIHTDKCDIDLAAVLKDLEELNPMTLLEIVDDDAKIKIWLE